MKNLDLVGQFVTANYRCIGKLLEYDSVNDIFYVENFDSTVCGWSFPNNKKALKKSTKLEIQGANTIAMQATKAVIEIGATPKDAQKFIEKTYNFLQERDLTQSEANSEMQKYIQSFA